MFDAALSWSADRWHRVHSERRAKESIMLWNATAIRGYVIEASDGSIGTVSDFLFDDAGWTVRWLVVDTGSWLSGRKVLLPVHVLGRLDADTREFTVRLTKQQVKDSPDIDTDRPVSRQIETNAYEYYGGSPYWGAGYYMGYGFVPGGVPLPVSEGSMRRDDGLAAAPSHDDDPHLRSVATVTGYHIEATDGEVGHADDFLIEDTDWSIHYLAVDTKNWWPAKKVLISPRLARNIDWIGRVISLDVDRDTVKKSPEYDPATIVDRDYESRFHSYYGDLLPGERSRPANDRSTLLGD